MLTHKPVWPHQTHWRADSHRLAKGDAKLLSVVLLRYFNPVGAHDSGLIGESPRGTPNNLFPSLAHVAAGKREKLLIFGNDYDTPDGTGIRDYIHVVNLARAHVSAMNLVGSRQGVEALNIGTGECYSVSEVVKGSSRNFVVGEEGL